MVGRIYLTFDYLSFDYLDPELVYERIQIEV